MTRFDTYLYDMTHFCGLPSKQARSIGNICQGTSYELCVASYGSWYELYVELYEVPWQIGTGAVWGALTNRAGALKHRAVEYSQCVCLSLVLFDVLRHICIMYLHIVNILQCLHIVIILRYIQNICRGTSCNFGPTQFIMQKQRSKGGCGTAF